MALTVISASGDAYSVGRMIGEEIAETVQRVTVHNEELVAAEQRWSASHYLDQLIAAARRTFPQYVRELEGMADGMGITFARAFLWNCRGDLHWPDDISPAVAAGLGEGCTSLIIPANDEQPAVIAHNEDGSADYHEHCYWVSVKPDKGPTFESFLYPGMIPGHTMATNGAGIVQTINNIRVHDLGPGLPRHFVCRAVLDCTTMDEALELLKRTDRAAGFHHNLGSAREGRLVSVEAPASGYTARKVTAKPVAHANHLIAPELREIPQHLTRSSDVRQSRADELLDRNALAEGGPTRILFDAQPGHEILRTPGDGNDDYGKTLATGVFELRADKVSVTVHDGPEHRNIHSVHIDL